jgi:sulfur relay (sulfurtransferase) complex TusBCD TusD component (DsrE family)
MLRGKKLGILLSVSPGHSNFSRAIALTEVALASGVCVYLYFLDDAVLGLRDERVARITGSGAKLFACAYASQRRTLQPHATVVLSGLTVLSDLIAHTDRFVSFN